MKIADVEDGVKSGGVSDDAAKLQEAYKRIRLLEQKPKSCAVLWPTCPGDINPKK